LSLKVLCSIAWPLHYCMSCHLLRTVKLLGFTSLVHLPVLPWGWLTHVSGIPSADKPMY
jgi:hypothetical protein